MKKGRKKHKQAVTSRIDENGIILAEVSWVCTETNLLPKYG